MTKRKSSRRSPRRNGLDAFLRRPAVQLGILAAAALLIALILLFARK